MLIFSHSNVLRHYNMLHCAGPAVMHLKEKIAQSEQGKGQLEHALSAQAKHSQGVEAELVSAHARTKQLEVRLHCYLPYGSYGILPA